MVYLTDGPSLGRATDNTRSNVTHTLPDDVRGYQGRMPEACIATDGKTAELLCHYFGLAEPLPCFLPSEVTLESGDAAIVASFEPDGTPHWAYRAYGESL